MKRLIIILSLLAIFSMFTVAAVPAAEPEVVYERNETLYTGGTQWGPPSSWNPMVTWGYAMGTTGLCYETLFIYDPFTNEYMPWLAESGAWTSPTVYDLTLRKGIKWSDGEPMTAADVVFTVELGKKFKTMQYNPVWDWLKSVDPTRSKHRDCIYITRLVH